MDLLATTIEKIGERGERTAVLIDEYDKPILDHIEDPARANEYALKCKQQGKRVRICGVAFDPETRNIGEWIE